MKTFRSLSGIVAPSEEIVRLIDFTHEKHQITLTRMKTMIGARLLPIRRIATPKETVLGDMTLWEEEASVSIIPGSNL